jgi:hypothetical protein
MTRFKLLAGITLSLIAIITSAILFACSQTPTSVPVRTFERAQRMDVACMQLYDPNSDPPFQPREPIGRPQEECAPVPSDLDGNSFPKQLYAFVTQTARGEVAVVNLSAGFLVDQSRATPGINFLPVGALPTDIATTPDGKMAFVASAEVNKAAIYGIPTRRLLGDTAASDKFESPEKNLSIASWPVCALPQNPGALAVIPRHKGAQPAGAADAGVADAGDGGSGSSTDAGAPSTELPAEYDLVVVLPGDRSNSAKVVVIDPRPFRRGGLRRTSDGKPDYNSDHLANEAPTLSDGPVLEPGSLAPCPITFAMELAGSDVLPKSFAPGPEWDDGVKYRDGGVDLTCLTPTPGLSCGPLPCCSDNNPPPKEFEGGVLEAGASEGGLPVIDAGACEPVTGATDAGPVPLDLGPLDPPRLVSVARDDQMLYVADEKVPLVHVLDMSTLQKGVAPRELPPYLATSQTDPGRAIQLTQLAVSPPTRDYKRYLYAIDKIEGSILVFDVTDPAKAQRSPLSRPHPELNPFQAPDRIAFSAPVVAVAFARHDLPLQQLNGVPTPSSASGVLCNPNHNLDSNPLADLGYFYRANSTDPGQDIGPRRLRGIFAFATLGNGQVLTIDVDDWDSPCRRPSDMSQKISDIAPAEPTAAAGDIDPYHAPNPTPPGGVPDPVVTNEAFFPMASPHERRSEVLITNNTTTGNQLPRLQGTQTISSNGIILSQVGMGSEGTPLLDVAFATEVPQVHVDQDWSVTWEGAIPGFDTIPGTLSTDDNSSSLIMSAPSARFCSKGVEDAAQGRLRTESIALALSSRNVSLPARSDRLMTDYIQLTEDLLDPSDDYWNLNQECWDPRLSTAQLRHDTCQNTYGFASDQNTQRDFPILEAFDDHVRLGRFFVNNGQREVVYADPSNAAQLKLMRCCFHNQVQFKVRTGQLWIAVAGAVGGGPGIGFMSHMTPDDHGRCAPSCEPRESLLNGRVVTIPAELGGELRSFGNVNANRNSALSMRNPMLDIRILDGLPGTKPIARDTVYTFSTRGQFRTLTVNIAGASIAVNPQSMRYIEALGQMAVVDGASQGLVLIDLRAVTVARAPYF